MSFSSKSALCCMALTLLLAAPGFAQLPIVNSGIDIFETGEGTVVSFEDDPIPADFFCEGSEPFKETLKLRGIPLRTTPPGIAGNSDTIVERLHDGDLTFGVTTVPIVVRALQMAGIEPVTVFCPASGYTRWSVSVCACNVQPITEIEIGLDDDACGCGKFNGEMAVNACLTFTNLEDPSDVRGPVEQSIVLGIEGTPWCAEAGPGALSINQPFHVDTNCSGKPDLALPCTTNFNPGWICPAGGLTCDDIFGHLTTCHENFGNPDAHDHCVNPVCSPRK